jgi:hypothetical protein
VTLRNLRVGESSVTIRFRLDGKGKSHFKVTARTGTLHVVRQQPINAMNVHWWNRVRAVVSR